MKWGRCEYRQLIKLRDNLAKLQSTDLDKFCRDMSRELAARLLSLVIPATPVGKYKKNSGKKGGTLRRGWTAKTQAEAMAGSGNTCKEVGAFTKDLHISKQGTVYTIEIVNPVDYASYVEFGHRTPSGKGWVNGKYFLTLSEQDLERLAPGVIERKLEAKLREAFMA